MVSLRGRGRHEKAEHHRRARRVLATLGAEARADEAPKPPPGLDRIHHIIVLYLENRSFDQLYGLFPGADGLADAGAAATQIDREGKPYDKLPPALDTNLKGSPVDARFPLALDNKPYRAEAYSALSETTGDLVHKFYQEQLQIDGGKMDKFVAWSNAGALVMSTYDGSHMPLWQYASAAGWKSRPRRARQAASGLAVLVHLNGLAMVRLK